MISRSCTRWSSLALLSAFTACSSGDTSTPTTGPAARVEAVSNLLTTAQVGSSIAEGVVVKVTDASGNPVAGTSVGFIVTVGNGTVVPRVAISDANGQASAGWTLGTVAGANQVLATVTGVPNTVTFVATGTAGPSTTLSLSPSSARLFPGTDTARITARGMDSFGNVVSPVPTFVVRDPTLVTIDANGLVHALRRGSATYVVATSETKTDSVLVIVLATGQSACTGVATPITLAVGQVVTNLGPSAVCVHGAADGAEYALVPYYNAAVVSATTALEVLPQGTIPLALTAASIAASKQPAPLVPTLIPDYSLEARMQAQARAEFPSRMAGARAWMASRGGVRRAAAATAVAVAVPAVGDLLHLNANASNFCAVPGPGDVRVGRVAAVTDKAIVVTDTANPSGGFTDEELRSIGVTFDTLVDPVDRAAFGDPTDIDNNGHVILFFTRAVNELTAPGSSSITLGFFYERDLHPLDTTLPSFGTPCPGSNVGEMFYLLVPDTGGVVNGKKITKTQVVTFTNGTVAHEYQHLINASRRLYINDAPNLEERWLDEGLAHEAEELNFFAASHRNRKTNIDASAFNDPVFNAAYNTFQLNNSKRYQTYLAVTERQAPVGSDPSDDDLQTRGAIWNYLRYSADHLTTGTENAFWQKLVNTTTTGLANLTAALGTAPNSSMRDWAISVFLDDNSTGVDPRFLEPSWNLRNLFTNNGTSLAFPLFTRTLFDGPLTCSTGDTRCLTLAAGGVSFMRFNVASGSDALLTLTSNGGPVATGIQVAVVRVK
ncbi:MAG: hypothetical protein ABI442_12995 [Gemmatimonadaceae bacterium]